MPPPKRVILPRGRRVVVKKPNYNLNLNLNDVPSVQKRVTARNNVGSMRSDNPPYNVNLNLDDVPPVQERVTAHNSIMKQKTMKLNILKKQVEQRKLEALQKTTRDRTPLDEEFANANVVFINPKTRKRFKQVIKRQTEIMSDYKKKINNLKGMFEKAKKVYDDINTSNPETDEAISIKKTKLLIASDNLEYYKHEIGRISEEMELQKKVPVYEARIELYKDIINDLDSLENKDNVKHIIFGIKKDIDNLQEEINKINGIEKPTVRARPSPRKSKRGHMLKQIGQQIMDKTDKVKRRGIDELTSMAEKYFKQQRIQ